ncbi:hypothetical protein EYF80_001323 [Liparis tanakae]|uniref:Uncharacterized protein n=1 Tax=Liparis tanakae TaxID=230148 RepID=A0A4Z2JEC2_9TELE|nr:hypothetical protein EYF80_001323 [Liparis tanakae]
MSIYGLKVKLASLWCQLCSDLDTHVEPFTRLLPTLRETHTNTSVYLMVDDATVSLEDRGLRLGHPDGGFSGPPQLFVLSDVRVVSVPGSAVEAAVVHEEQARAQEEHEEHGDPMALTQRHKQMLPTASVRIPDPLHSARAEPVRLLLPVCLQTGAQALFILWRPRGQMFTTAPPLGLKAFQSLEFKMQTTTQATEHTSRTSSSGGGELIDVIGPRNTEVTCDRRAYLITMMARHDEGGNLVSGVTGPQAQREAQWFVVVENHGFQPIANLFITMQVFQVQLQSEENIRCLRHHIEAGRGGLHMERRSWTSSTGKDIHEEEKSEEQDPSSPLGSSSDRDTNHSLEGGRGVTVTECLSPPPLLGSLHTSALH